MNKISIYKISSPTCEQVYVGSTKNSITERFWYHKSNYKKYCEGRNSYCSSYEIIDKDYENVKIELLEECSSENRKDRERYWIRNLDTINIKKLKTKEERNAHYRQKRLQKKLNLPS